MFFLKLTRYSYLFPYLTIYKFHPKMALYMQLIAFKVRVNTAALYCCICNKYNVHLYFSWIAECQHRKHSLHDASEWSLYWKVNIQKSALNPKGVFLCLCHWWMLTGGQPVHHMVTGNAQTRGGSADGTPMEHNQRHVGRTQEETTSFNGSIL